MDLIPSLVVHDDGREVQDEHDDAIHEDNVLTSDVE